MMPNRNFTYGAQTAKTVRKSSWCMVQNILFRHRQRCHQEVDSDRAAGGWMTMATAINTSLIGEVGGMVRQAETCAEASQELLAVLAHLRSSVMLRDCKDLVKNVRAGDRSSFQPV